MALELDPKDRWDLAKNKEKGMSSTELGGSTSRTRLLGGVLWDQENPDCGSCVMQVHKVLPLGSGAGSM